MMDSEMVKAASRERLNAINRELAEAVKHIRKASGLVSQLDLFLGSWGIGWRDINEWPEVRLEVRAVERYFEILASEVVERDGE